MPSRMEKNLYIKAPKSRITLNVFHFCIFVHKTVYLKNTLVLQSLMESLNKVNDLTYSEHKYKSREV